MSFPGTVLTPERSESRGQTASTGARATVGRSLYWLVLVSPAALPLLVTYLPFQDWPGHVGLLGVLTHWDEPAFGLRDDYFFRGWVGPNRLFYLVAWPLCELFGVLTGARLALALFLGALGPAVHLLARELDTDPRVALWVPPLALGRHLFCGFAPNAAALPLMVLGFAAFLRLRKRPCVLRALALFATAVATLDLHVFIFLALTGLLVLSCGLDLARRRFDVAAYCAPVLLALIPLTVWFGRPAAETSGSGTMVALLQALSVPSLLKAQQAWTWLFASYHRSVVDDGLQAIWLALGLAAAAASALARRRRPRAEDETTPGPSPADGARLHLGLWFGACMVVFLAFSEYVGPPVNWWGASLRLPVPAAILAIVLLAPPRATQAARADTETHRRSGRWVFVGGGAVSAAFVTYVIFTTARFQHEEMRGFEAVVDRIPLGVRTCPLHDATELTADYPGVVHGYVGNYVVARRGGRVAQGVFGNAGVVFGSHGYMAQPGWGLRSGFSWARHHRDCDVFLVRQDPEPPWREEQAGRVVRWASSPTWSLYAPASAASRPGKPTSAAPDLPATLRAHPVEPAPP